MLSVAELARDAVQAQYGRRHDGASSPIFSGKNPRGKPRRGHAHAHYLPEDTNGDGRVDLLTIWAPEGFGPGECAALAGLRELRRAQDPYPLHVTLVALLEARPAGGLFGPAACWESATPFLLPRHPKRNGKDSPEDQLELELRRRGLPSPVSIKVLPPYRPGGRRPVHWLEFRRWRRRGRAPAVARGYGFRIEFQEPVLGPIALGYGSHFGLGLFSPASSTPR